MEFNQENEVVKLCIEGMELEGKGENAQASEAFNKAWSVSKMDFEKFTSAHYVARHQISVGDKLKWDEIALSHALRVNDKNVKEALPSLYLNVGKCYEDLNDLENARSNYSAAKSYFDFLPDDGYGNMIRKGVENVIERVEKENK